MKNQNCNHQKEEKDNYENYLESNFFTDKDFADIFQENLDELPPEDIVQEVTPWRKGMNRALAGLALSTFTLDFLKLNYILPFIGYILIVLGFRALRRENRWFRLCWVISSIRAVYWYFWFLINTTIYNQALEQNVVFSALPIVNMVLLFILFYCLWRGFKAVKRKAGLSEHAGSAVALMVWCLITLILGLLKYSGVLGWIVIIMYICIIRSLFKLSRELDEAGYLIQSASVKVSDRVLVIGILIVLCIGITCGYLFFNRYPMEWTEQNVAQDAELQEIKSDLIALGFPEYILEDLLEEDIRACKDAQYVIVDVFDHALNDGRVVKTQEEDSIYINTVYDVKELRITGIGVLLPDERETWKIFHYFQYVESVDFYGTESLQIWPAYRSTRRGWGEADDFSGQVLYDDEGQTYTAPYYSLGKETYTSNNIIWGESTSTDVFATFSMPKDGENPRGYVSYGIKEMQDGAIVDAWINYTHQKSWFQFPVMTAKEHRIRASAIFGDKGPFRTVQDALQFHPTKDRVDLIN